MYSTLEFASLTHIRILKRNIHGLRNIIMENKYITIFYHSVPLDILDFINTIG